MHDNIALATAALQRLLSRRPELIADKAWMNDFVRGYIACYEAVDAGDDLSPTANRSEGFVAGYEEALRDLGILD
jgi:hypothetical protein